MECSEAQEHLSDLNRGRLQSDTAEVVRAHVAQCAACAAALQEETRIRVMVQMQARRYSAPPALKTRIQALLAQAAPSTESVTPGAALDTRRPAARSSWLHVFRAHPWTVGSLVGAAAVLLVVWTSWLWLARDSVSVLADRAVAEHLEYVKEAMTHPVADPSAVISQVKGQVDFALEPVFSGDSQVQLVTGKVEDFRGKRAAIFIYRDGSGHYTTLFLMPEAGIAIPDGGRMPIETFKPYHRVTSGHQLLLWKQRNLACVLVSDLDQAGIASMFLRVRKTA
jgi:anti-sigma factor RsiW